MSDQVKELSGRELDTQVAEFVMGWTLTRRGGEGKYRDSMYWKGAPDKGSQVDWHWNPSTDIAAAMEVLDKADGMWELTRCVEREVLDDDSTPFVLRYRCSLRFGDNLGHSSGCATAPEAICRAALAAVAHNEPERNTES